jgi:hypothetical protein
LSKLLKQGFLNNKEDSWNKWVGLKSTKDQ